MATLPVHLSPEISSNALSNLKTRQAEKAAGGFENLLNEGLQSVNQQINQSNQMAQEFMAQGKHELHDVMINLEKADLNFRFMTQVRNKVLDAYNEIMKMQI